MTLCPAAPFIPPSSIEEVVNQRKTVLLWVIEGLAEVTVTLHDHTCHHRIRSGQFIYIAPGIRHSVHTDENTVAIPLLNPVDSGLDLDNDVLITPIPEGWHQFILWSFSLQLGYTEGGPRPLTSADNPFSLFLEASKSETCSGMVLPYSREALAAAKCLLENPADDRTLEQLSQDLAIASRTLQRQFSSETGLSFSLWRQRVRINAAKEYLVAGRTVEWTGHAVGFKTAGSLVRSFRRETGLTPGEFLKRTAADEINGYAIALSEPHAIPTVQDPPILPESSTWERINDFDVILWMYCGSAVVELADSHVQMKADDTLRIPAGVRNRISTAEGSLILPVFSAKSSEVSLPPTSAAIVSIPHGYKEFMLHAVVSNNTGLRPLDSRYQEDLHSLLVEDSSTDTSNLAPEFKAVTTIINALTRKPAINVSMQEWAEKLSISVSQLNQAFIQATGDTFPRWRATLRASEARKLLDAGVEVSVAARKVGYTHTSALSKTFNEVHGMSPREYIRSRQWRW